WIIRGCRLGWLGALVEMRRLPKLNVDSWSAGVRCGDGWTSLSAAPNALLLPLSAEDVFGALIARNDSQRDRINLSDRMLSERSPRASFRSAPHRTMWRSAVRHERDVSNIRLVASAVNRDQPSIIAHLPTQTERTRGRPRRPCGTHGRSEAESVDAAEHAS